MYRRPKSTKTIHNCCKFQRNIRTTFKFLLPVNLQLISEHQHPFCNNGFIIIITTSSFFWMTNNHDFSIHKKEILPSVFGKDFSKHIHIVFQSSGHLALDPRIIFIKRTKDLISEHTQLLDTSIPAKENVM